MKTMITLLPCQVVALLTLSACSTIGPFNSNALQQATSAKVDTLALVGKSTEPYSDHVTDIKALQLSYEKAYEYCKSMPKNELSTKQWDIMRSSVLIKFVDYWKKDGILSPTYISDEETLITREFDKIIELENGKNKN